MQDPSRLFRQHIGDSSVGGNSTFLGITSYSEPRSTRYGLDSDAAWLYHEGVHLNPTSDLLCAWVTQ